MVLPERDLRSFQYKEGLSQWLELERFSCHFWWACWEKDEDICSLSWVIWGLEGSALWKESCSDMRAAISGVMWGIK